MPLPQSRASFTRTIASTSEAMQDLVDHALKFLAHFHGGEGDGYYYRLALDEALENARTHGNHGDPDKMIFLTVEVYDDKIVITIRDEGEGFNPWDVPDPKSDENKYRLHGRGLCLLKNLFAVTWSDGGRCIRIER